MMDLSEEDIKIIKKLQGDIPIVRNPYQTMADELGIRAEFLLERIEAFRENGILKRLATVLRHQSIGFTANAMSVWRVEADRTEKAGLLFAKQAFVSHCYQRPSLPDFPYTLYAMIHATSKDECFSYAEILSRLSGISDYRLLFSVTEFKKSSMRYFE